VGKEGGIVGAQEKFNKKIGMNSFHRKNEISIILASLGLSSKVQNKISWNFREMSAKFRFKMAETENEDFSGTRNIWGQDLWLCLPKTNI
jgi:hypothetical protein